MMCTDMREIIQEHNQNFINRQLINYLKFSKRKASDEKRGGQPDHRKQRPKIQLSQQSGIMEAYRVAYVWLMES